MFPDTASKAEPIKGNVCALDFIRIKNACFLKNTTINENSKDKPQDGRKYSLPLNDTETLDLHRSTHMPGFQ